MSYYSSTEPEYRVVYLTNCDYIYTIMSCFRGELAKAPIDRATPGTPVTVRRKLAGVDVCVHIHRVNARIRVCSFNIEEALAGKNVGTRRAVTEDFEAIKHADGAVFVASLETHLYARSRRHLEILRRDLIAAGRDPSTFPVIFEMVRFQGGEFASEEAAKDVLRWPLCEYLWYYLSDSETVEERGHERALDWVLEHAAQR